MKALSDASRLRIVGVLADGRSMTVVELASALGLTPGTVVHRRQAGDDATPTDAPAWASAEQARVLRSFIDGERLTGIPAQHAKRLVVLRLFAETVFEPATDYPEKEVNMRLALRHPTSHRCAVTSSTRDSWTANAVSTACARRQTGRCSTPRGA